MHVHRVTILVLRHRLYPSNKVSSWVRRASGEGYNGRGLNLNLSNLNKSGINFRKNQYLVLFHTTWLEHLKFVKFINIRQSSEDITSFQQGIRQRENGEHDDDRL